MADFKQYIVVKVADNAIGSKIREFAREAGAEGHLTVSSDKAWIWENKNFFAEVQATYEEYMAGARADFLQGSSDKPQSIASASRPRTES